MRTILKYDNRTFGYIVYALIAAAITCAFLAGCGSDEITGNNGNPPVSNNDSLIFSVDSFTVRSNDIARIAFFEFRDTTNKSRKYKVVVNVSSDVPASNDTAFCEVATYTRPGTPNFFHYRYTNADLNNLNANITYTVDSTLGAYDWIGTDFTIGFRGFYPANPIRYISVKKFQLFIVN